MNRRKKAKRPKPSEDERRSMLRDLTDVGPSKPVGYLPLHAIKNFVQLSPKAVAAAAAARGLAAAQFNTKQCRIKSGALYVYHRKALAHVLQTQADVVEAAGLPLDPDGFVAHIAAVWFEADHPVYAVIKTAFADIYRRDAY
ncbi:MAG: hypothetical protein ACLP1D_00830 [Xanthobacteraceae bacterium]